MNKKQRAKKFLADMRDQGIEPEINGNWIKWPPIIGVENLMVASELANEIADILKDETTGGGE